MFAFFTNLCFGRKLTALESDLQRQRKALQAIEKFVSCIQSCLKYWDRSGRVLRCGIQGYFFDKPMYQHSVEDIMAALNSLKTISTSVRPQLDLIKRANKAAAKSIARVEKANKQKRKAERKVKRKEEALKKLAAQAQRGKDPQAHQKLKAAEDEIQVATNYLQIAEAELSRELQQAMNGAAPEAAMQVTRALEVLLLFLVGSGVDVDTVRASIRALEETPFLCPTPGATRMAGDSLHHQVAQSSTSRRENKASISYCSNSSAAAFRSHLRSSNPATPTEPGSQQISPRKTDPAAGGTSASNSNQGAVEGQQFTSLTNPFTSE